jgi:hypothetical protein
MQQTGKYTASAAGPPSTASQVAMLKRTGVGLSMAQTY